MVPLLNASNAERAFNQNDITLFKGNNKKYIYIYLESLKH